MNIVCRDVQKAFDKVWTQGLKYKIITIPELPLIIQKILCSYVTKRTAQIRIENFIGDKITLESGVGSCVHDPNSKQKHIHKKKCD